MSLPNAIPEPVERAAHFPGFCYTCSGIKGPFVDTGSDRPSGAGDAHIYICRSCGRDIARILGYVKGERADQLDAASDRLSDAERERDEAADAAHKMADALTDAQAKITVLQRDLDAMRGERDQAKFILQQIGGRVNEALVGNGAT